MCKKPNVYSQMRLKSEEYFFFLFVFVVIIIIIFFFFCVVFEKLGIFNLDFILREVW